MSEKAEAEAKYWRAQCGVLVEALRAVAPKIPCPVAFPECSPAGCATCGGKGEYQPTVDRHISSLDAATRGHLERVEALEKVADHLREWHLLGAFMARHLIFGGPAITPENLQRVMTPSVTALDKLRG